MDAAVYTEFSEYGENVLGGSCLIAVAVFFHELSRVFWDVNRRAFEINSVQSKN